MITSILDYIPQRPPMVMVDELIYADHSTAVSTFMPVPETLFVECGKLTEPGLIENIAQTAAALVGYQCARQKIPVPMGYIAAIKNLKINFTPAVRSVIQTTVVVTNQVMDVTLVDGKVEQFGNLLCSCEMRILIKK